MMLAQSISEIYTP